MMDFTPSPAAAFSEAFGALIDIAMQAKQQMEKPRTYLGGSRLGVECERALGYEYAKAKKDEGREFEGKILRIFDRGHDAETRFADYLRLAGFTILTERPDGKQFGFYIAKDGEGVARIAGHCDGIITGWAAPDTTEWPAALREASEPIFAVARGMKFPCLWEMKSLGDKGWKDTQKKGVQVSKPVYYTQVQIYMHQFVIHENPALFTAINGNTGEIYAELVPFSPVAVQAGIDRGARVVSALSATELPRISKEPTDFRCKFCDYAIRCWAKADEPSQPPSPTWWGKQNG